MRGVFGASVVLALALCATGEAFAQVRADDVKEDLKGLYERHLRLELRDGKLFVDGKEVDRGDPEAIRKALPRFQIAQDDTPWLGVSFEPVEDGARLLQVFADSPAEQAGLKESDVILEVDGDKLDEIEDLRDAVGRHKPGENLKLKIRRGEQTLDVEVKLARRPARFRMLMHAPQLGDPKTRLGVVCENTDDGVCVMQVDDDSPAVKAGVKPGDIILGVDGRPIVRISELKELLSHKRPGDKAELNLRRDGKELDVKVTPAGPGFPPGVDFKPLAWPPAPEIQRLRRELDEMRKEIEKLKRQMEELRRRLPKQDP